MNEHSHLGRRTLAVAVWLLATLAAAGQTDTTKSGTVVTAAPRTKAFWTEASKEANCTADSGMGVLAVVAPAEWREALEPLLQWKRQQGYGVEFMAIADRRCDSVRARLRERFEKASPLRPGQKYVLLVGDADRIQPFWGSHTPTQLSRSVTDLYFGEYTGDYLPEAMVGRLSVQDSGELAAVVAKTVAYEQGAFAHRSLHALAAAGKELNPTATTSTNGQVRYVGELTARQHPATDTVCFYNPQTDSLRPELLQAIDTPNAFVNYTAHCTRAGWQHPDVSAATIDSLGNPSPTLYVNNCCLSNDFAATCFGERLLRTPTGGAAAVIGATNETLWKEDYYWAVGAQYPLEEHPPFDALRPGAFARLMEAGDGGPRTAGEMLWGGCRAVSEAGSNYDAYYWETYCLIGDPTLTPYLESADSASLRLPDTLWRGDWAVEAESEPHTLVTVVQDTMLIGSAEADSAGHARLRLPLPLSADSATFTAWKAGSTAAAVKRPLTSPPSGRLAATSTAYCEGELRVRLLNVGSRTARGHSAALTAEGLSAATALLEPGDDTLVRLALRPRVGEAPIYEGTLTLADSSGTAYCHQPFAVEVPDLRPLAAAASVVDEEGAAARRLQPGANYRIALELTHPADSAAAEIGGIRTVPHLEDDGRRCTVPLTLADSTAATRCALHLFRDDCRTEWVAFLLPYQACEDFESGGLDSYPWQHPSANPWTTDSSHAAQGRYCARSGTAPPGQHSTLMMEIECLADDSLSFRYNISGSETDWLYCHVDGKRKFFANGRSGWRRKALPLTAGSHRIEFIYQKSGAGVENDDCAYIDDVGLPLCRWRTAGGTVCRDSTLAARPAAAAAERIEVFPNPARGTITLRLNGTPAGCAQARLLRIYDTFGRLVDTVAIPKNCSSTQYFAGRLRCGIYTVAFSSGRGASVEKMIVTH